MKRINFINPFGTKAYDEIIWKTLSNYCSSDTELHVTHLENCPSDIDFFYSKHMIEQSLYEAVLKSEEAGYDAVIVGCLYDPGVRAARELVDIPIVGPLEASFQTASYFGHSTMVLTDHRKAVPYISDQARLNAQGETVRGVEAIDWFVKDMINDRSAVVRDVVERSKVAAERFGAETVILGCTIIAAIYQEHLMEGGAPSSIPIINPNLMALKIAEALADLYKNKAYFIARDGFYMKPSGHHEQEFRKARKIWNQSAIDFSK
ncbi:Asp/Glu/hydantoin racemase (plasmid) [Rhizobium leguminosarum bv. trifolii WSM2304]|uniref:Asp/Glu/hydantoin racemase n=1 Tax=Rhizobium leguminosarum bv. trifolii (strain WSM2304) TaxID=395492 RepID=A0ABF7QZR0_RHILW|nr:aspartate/glutamate racemase family protein [Rhizobium leguminosarum]ACI59641.1 Asp/Glu/hydantoin racemase [Rhizobium leguminosarum bv. trifolii WSM2304]